MKKLGFILGIIIITFGAITLLGGAGSSSLVLIIPGALLLLVSNKKKKKERKTITNESDNKGKKDSQPQSIDRFNTVNQTIQPSTSLESSTDEEKSSTPVSQNNISKKLSKSTRKNLIQAVPAGNSYIDSLKNVFFAVDVETSGLSPESNRVIEIAAVKFENGTAVDSYSTLVDSVRHIPEAASSVNGITDEELEFYGEDESSAFDQFTNFLGHDTLEGNICLVAHNASFDMAFIINSLKRLKYNEDVTLRYFDTLYLSRKYLALPNYKQPTVADYYGITNDDEHRAEGDAMTCGEILVHLLENMENEAEQARITREKYLPTDEEREICAYIKKVLKDAGKETTRLRFEKKSGGKITAKYPYGFASFKILKKKAMYFIVEKSDYVKCELVSKDTDYRNGKAYSVRVNLEHPKQIELLADSFVKAYKRDEKHITDFYRHPRWVQLDTEKTFQIDDNEVESLVNACNERADEKAMIKAANDAEKAALEKEKEERRLARKLRAEEEVKHPKPKSKSRGRKIGRYDDDMNLLEEYQSVASASSSVGISPKCIRDAASGRQKHAAGYIWKYLDLKEEDNI